MSRFDYMDLDDAAVATVVSGWTSPVVGCKVDYPLSNFTEPDHTDNSQPPACYVDWDIRYVDSVPTFDSTATPFRQGVVNLVAWVQKGHVEARSAARSLQRTLADAFVTNGDTATVSFIKILPFTVSRRDRDKGFDGRGLQIHFSGV